MAWLCFLKEGWYVFAKQKTQIYETVAKMRGKRSIVAHALVMSVGVALGELSMQMVVNSGVQ